LTALAAVFALVLPAAPANPDPHEDNDRDRRAGDVLLGPPPPPEAPNPDMPPMQAPNPPL
jgi:hypothetical protein